MINRDQNQRGNESSQRHKGVGQHGTAPDGGTDPEETRTGANAMESPKSSGGAERRKGEDFGKDKSQPDGDADNPSETTGATEAGNEDHGAK